MRTVVLLALAALLVSGCTSSGSKGGAPASAPSSTTSVSAAPLKPVVTSDTLHLLAAPLMSTVAPTGSSDTETAMTTGGFGGPGMGGQQTGAMWAYNVSNAANITQGEIHVWVKITDTLVQSPGNPTSTTQCTWSLRLELGGGNGRVPVACISEPAGPIQATSAKELVFKFDATSPIGMEANETVTARLTRNAFSLSQNNSVFVLSGSADHDSRLVLTGLKEPVPGA